MRVLITGGAGFIGGALSARLVDRGDEVVVVDDLSNGSIDRVPEGAHFVRADVVRDRSELASACDGVEVVFHEAALRSVPRSIDEPLLVHDVNATGTLAVLETARAAGVRRMVYASSSSVYGGVDASVSEESMPPRPLSPYAVSKLVGEYYCRVWAEMGWLETVSLRYFNVFGPGQRADSKYAAVFPAFISALIERRPPEIHWDGEQSRDFTFIDDVVDVNLLAAEKAPGRGEVFNAAGGKPRSINEVARSIRRALGVDIEALSLPKREGDIRHSRADTSKVREILGWEPRTNWEEAIDRTVQWFMDAPSLRGSV